ncbi:MAG: putative sulfate/molybdate transporter [Candidatus Marinimicrobia bacterium]|nr:putative sulfate/molybdate transporter [Candidatus Neomarinimicrobiota bacterium]MCF7829296.1 putative sulfate/molybdate transporter [Candidatus Neomarinimicrobiota bacterium]MCF7880042.1 putative sulfate/molybdate transporter [Candidatus Neomarinimicrobiota bacterium]
MNKPKNTYGWSEFSGAIGDLGTTLPLAFALVISNGFPSARIFLLWGIVYIITGWYYKVPVSVQPLKAMAVIAITAGFSAGMLSTAAVLYGVLFIILSSTGLIKWLQKWFSQAIVRGIQLGIGLLLAKKALALIYEKTLFLDGALPAGNWILLMALGTLGILIAGKYLLKRPIALVVIVASVAASLFFGIRPGVEAATGSAVQFSIPHWSQWWDILVLLMIPQLPLTLGNAVYAANDACHEFWGKQARRVNTSKLAGSIGLSDIFIGLLGGFPICHGAGGIAAHSRFGGKTGGTTIILGIAFVTLALVGNLSTFLFLIPIPILGTLLLFDSWAMIILVRRLADFPKLVTAVTVGTISLATHNLTLALIAGLIIERIVAIERVNTMLVRIQQKLSNQLTRINPAIENTKVEHD